MKSPARILIVEDDMIVLMHLQSIVTGLGHELVGTAANPADALTVAGKTPPDMVLMDIRLEGDGDGVEAARSLRDRHGCAVIFVTAYSDRETVLRSTAIGASGYIVKPFTAADVGAAIATGLASHQLLHESRQRERELTSALGGMSEGVLVVDQDEVVRFANPWVVDLTGWPALEAYDRNVFDVVRIESEGDVDEFRQAMRRVLTLSEPGGFLGLRLLTRDGDVRVVDARITPVQEGSSAPTGLVLALREHNSASGARESGARRRRDTGTRLLVYSHDTLGLGHLRRCLNLLRALAASPTEVSALLVTGSPVAHRYELPEGMDYLKLPAVRKVAPDEYSPRFLSMSDGGIHSLRSNLLLRTIRDYAPDVLLVDHSPTGMNGELLPALEWSKREGRCTRILGLRDIIDDPEAVVRKWEKTGVYDRFRDTYDHLVVYGSPDFYDTVREYRLPPEVARKTHYVHAVTDGTECEDRDGGEGGRDQRLVGLTIGGGDGGADSVVVPFLEMMEEFGGRLDIHAEVILGPLVGREKVGELRTRAEKLPVTIRTFVQDPRKLYRRARLVIGTAGYNTSVEILSHAARAILVPRVLHRQEQLIRARRLEDLGLVKCLHPEDVSSPRLFEEIRRALSLAPAPLVVGRAKRVIPLDGAERFAAFFLENVAKSGVERT